MVKFVCVVIDVGKISRPHIGKQTFHSGFHLLILREIRSNSDPISQEFNQLDTLQKEGPRGPRALPPCLLNFECTYMIIRFIRRKLIIDEKITAVEKEARKRMDVCRGERPGHRTKGSVSIFVN